jgi:uncharacterized protein (TIGR02145 family)
MKKIILACTISIMCCAAYGQVTIGTDEEPIDGTLLQLKNIQAVSGGNVNATKGMNLPRVKLVNLKPVAATGANSLPASIGSPQSESWDLATHTGLVVYNIYRCPAGRTIYNETGPQVWDGSRWQLFNKPALTAASPVETSGADIWGKGVVHHAAKPNPDYVSETATPGEPENIYEDFYSADFGTAGRWMTTNLAAWKYDGIMHSQSDGNSANGETGRTLTGPNVSGTVTSYNTAYWYYPGGGTSSTAYNINPFLGLLYTWDAATAGKGGDTGRRNIYNLTSGNTAANNESAREYDPAQLDGTQTGFPGNGTSGYQWRIQGICPQGWHLPSDYEWYLLEKEIIRNTSDYSTVADINAGETNNRNETSDQIQIPAAGVDGTTGGRVDGLGTAMKDVCGVNAVIPNGQSNQVANSGFSVLLVGSAINGSMYGFGTTVNLCTSSDYNQNDYVWNRSLHTDNTVAPFAVKTYSSRRFYYSVRCVKD